MRNTLALLLCVAALAACTSRNLAYQEDGGGNGGHDLLRPPPDLAGKPCQGLDEQSCNAANCRANYCDFCDCKGLTFIGCTDVGEPGGVCPAIACDESACGSCQKLDEKSCGTVDGCTAAYCYNECALTSEYMGCYGPSEGQPPCPIYDCIPGCRLDQDCSAGTFCLAPGESYCGDVCEVPAETCNGDFDCDGDQICEQVECSCGMTIKACKDGCTSDDQCGVGRECEQKRCRAKTCTTTTQCPSQFECGKQGDRTACKRRPCSADPGCKNGFCVEGACYDELGMCTWLPG